MTASALELSAKHGTATQLPQAEEFIPLRLHGAAMTKWILPCLVGGTPPSEEFIPLD